MESRRREPGGSPAARIDSLLASAGLVVGSDGVFARTHFEPNPDQRAEVRIREHDAAQSYDDYLAYVSRLYSVPVMDWEVRRYLSQLPQGALVLDIGGCFGWHWRHLANTRPDVGVVITDFVRQNFVHARRVLGSLVGTQVAFVLGDATALPFPDGENSPSGFDGVWTVQVFQHIPNFALACREAHRVLKVGGRFANYSMQPTPLNRMIYRLAGKRYHTSGLTKPGASQMPLNRASDEQRSIMAQTFSGKPIERFTECLYHPDLRVTFSGRADSLLGRIDARLGEYPSLGRWIARQRSFEATKNR